jgi:hypothetical protein
MFHIVDVLQPLEVLPGGAEQRGAQEARHAGRITAIPLPGFST